MPRFMKYIVTKSEEGSEEIFVFPMTIPHREMANAVSRLKNQLHGDWRRIDREPVSAGFVENGVCVGDSESLGLKSRPEDTELLKRS